MAQRFLIHKPNLIAPFTGINSRPLGQAIGKLKHCGLKLYLYLSGNKDGFEWTINPSVFASWLGVDYSNDSKARAVRKVISDGIEDLKTHKYLKEVEKDKYEFYESPYE